MGTMTTMERCAWLPMYKRDPGSRSRLFCFPYAGGAAQAFRDWQPPLSTAGVELCALQPPGRWDRVREPVFTRMRPLVEAVVGDLREYLVGDFSFFGHSVGALVAFEVARELRRRGRPGPRHLFVAGRRAPHLTGSALPIHGLSDETFVAALMDRYAAIPAAVLADADLMRMLLPFLRADLEVHETYVCDPEPPLDCPIHVFGGEQDDTATPKGLRDWRHHTSAALSVTMFPGRHFFIAEAREAVLSALLLGLGEDTGGLPTLRTDVSAPARHR
jgi:medium-chain acyl-[acyl-carrier-protein] hydrolase